MNSKASSHSFSQHTHTHTPHTSTHKPWHSCRRAGQPPLWWPWSSRWLPVSGGLRRSSLYPETLRHHLETRPGTS